MNTAVIDSSLIDMPITINPPLTNISLGDVLNALVLAAPKPIHYSVEDYAIVFSDGKTSVSAIQPAFPGRIQVCFTAAVQNASGIKLIMSRQWPETFLRHWAWIWTCQASQFSTVIVG